jgi:hypothetical protein
MSGAAVLCTGGINESKRPGFNHPEEKFATEPFIVAQVERLHWRIWNGKAKNVHAIIDRIRAVMPVFKPNFPLDFVRGAKVWGTPHFFLAPIRRGRLSASCAAAAQPFRAEPCRA